MTNKEHNNFTLEEFNEAFSDETLLRTVLSSESRYASVIASGLLKTREKIKKLEEQLSKLQDKIEFDSIENNEK